MRRLAAFLLALLFSAAIGAQERQLSLPLTDYENKVQAIWTAQMLAAMMGWPFEHKVASVQWIDSLDAKFTHAPADDDWYYEMVAIRAFERYGTRMTVQDLGRQWIENNAGSWGSSEQARLLMQHGVPPPDCGHPRYNKLWFSIGPQFSADVYGALAPGMPNLAAGLARNYGHINGYAEGVDGAVFIAGMISLGFAESDPQVIVAKAAQLIDPSSPYRQCLDKMMQWAHEGKNAGEVFDAIEAQWHMEYPATNNAVANGGIVAACVWFGGGDFLKTINLAYSAADFTDADCNAANAASVVAALHGMKALPQHLVRQLGDSIIGDQLGKVALTPVVRETISGLAKRTAAVGKKLLAEHGVRTEAQQLRITVETPHAQPAELFRLADLVQYWNPQWTLERAGFGGAGGGMPNIRGITYLDRDVLATYPRDEVKGVELRRTLAPSGLRQIAFDAGVDSGRVWQCVVFAGNRKLFDKVLEGIGSGRTWQHIQLRLEPMRNSTVIRIYQRVLVPGRTAGNAYWKNMEIL